MMLCVSLQACEKITEILQTVDQNQQSISSPAQDTKAKKLYLALQSYDSQKLKPLLSQSLRQQIEHEPVALIEVFKLIPEGQANFGKLDQAHYSQSEDVGAMTTQVYTFEHADTTLALTIVFKGHLGGDEVIAFTLDQIQNHNQQKPLQLGQVPPIEADAIAVHLPNMGLGSDLQGENIQDQATAPEASVGQAAASAEIDQLLAQSRAMSGSLATDQRSMDLGGAVQVDSQAKDLTGTQNITQKNVSHQSPSDQVSISRSAQQELKNNDAAANQDSKIKQNNDRNMNNIVAEVTELKNLADKKDTKEMKGATEAKDVKENKKMSDATEVKGLTDLKENKKAKGVTDVKENKKAKGEVEGGHMKEVEDSTDVKGLAEQKQVAEVEKTQPAQIPQPETHKSKLSLTEIDVELNQLKE